MDLARTQGTVVFSPATFAELQQVLGRQKFDRHIVLADRLEFGTLLARIAEWVSPSERISACRDESDNRILEATVASRADWLVIPASQ